MIIIKIDETRYLNLKGLLRIAQGVAKGHMCTFTQCAKSGGNTTFSAETANILAEIHGQNMMDATDLLDNLDEMCE